MAIKMLMDITMAYALFLLLLLIPETVARYLSGGAVETQPGLTATNGISPVPTEAPGLNGIPKELRKRAIQSFIYPPPPNWCGMVDGDYQNILSCPPNTPCLLKSSFYGACGCTSLNTDLCFDVSPTICVDYDVYETVISLGSLTVPCDNSLAPYCLTLTSSGFRSFGCDSTSLPRTHSFVPVAAYYESFISTPAIVPSNTSPAQTTSPATPSSCGHAPSPPVEKVKLSTSAVAGIGIGAGLATAGVIAAIAICLWRKRKRGRPSPIPGGVGPVMAQTTNNPQGSQGIAQPVQQYQPQIGNTKFPEPADIPPYSPAPVYTSGGQHLSTAPITPYERTNDTNIASKYPSSTVTATLPSSPNLFHQTHQQQHTAPSWDYPPNSPVSTLGPGRPDIYHREISLSQSELGAGEAGRYRTSSPWGQSELGAGENDPNPLRNPSELPGLGEARVP